MTALTREDFLDLVDIDIKKVVVPQKIAKWAGKELFIKQLTRGDQDQFLKRQFGAGKRVDSKSEIPFEGLYGHDSWICSRAVCNEKGEKLFSEEDIVKLDGKSGEFIGWLAERILEFSGMREDAEQAKKLSKANEELKN